MSVLESTPSAPHTVGSLLYVGATASRSTSPCASRVNLALSPDNHPDGGPSRPPSPNRSTRNFTNDPLFLEDDVATPNGTEKIFPIAPTDVMTLKYHRFEYYPTKSEDAKVTQIKAYQREYKRENAPAGWRSHVCPEGKLYFAHEEKRVVTLTNIQNPEDYRRVMEAMEILYPKMPDDSSDFELLIQCTWANDDPVIGYYFADWENQVVFWHEDVDHTLVTNGERPPVSGPHLQLATHSQFGLHVEMFCAHHVLPTSMIEEVKHSFESGTVDVITSDQSMFSYDAEITNRIARILDRVPTHATINRHTSWIVGRSYKTLYSDRFLAFYGESGARCSRSDNAFKDTARSRRTPIFFLISPILFFMPLVYLKELDAAFVDQTVHYHAWRRFIAVLKRDWENAITPATVLLSANVGFLAIQSIDNSGASGNRSAAQIASYISAILSLFIYISCQILTRRHRHHENEQAERALKFLASRKRRLLGLQAVAMAFSLPIALFMWSMISFLAAMVFVFFDKTNLATKVTLGAILGVLLVMIGALLYMEWDNAAPWSGFGIFWAELKKYAKLPSERLRKPARRDSDVNSCASGARSEGNESETSINVEVESMTEHASDSEPSIRSENEEKYVSSLKRSVSSLSSLVERSWWPFRWWIRGREKRDGRGSVSTSRSTTLPMYSAQTLA